MEFQLYSLVMTLMCRYIVKYHLCLLHHRGFVYYHYHTPLFCQFELFINIIDVCHSKNNVYPYNTYENIINCLAMVDLSISDLRLVTDTRFPTTFLQHSALKGRNSRLAPEVYQKILVILKTLRFINIILMMHLCSKKMKL